MKFALSTNILPTFQKLAFWRYVHKPQWITKKLLLICLASLALIFVSVNLGLFWYFRSHTYPQTTVSSLNLSMMTFSQAEQELSMYVKTYKIQLHFANQTAKLTPQELGIAFDAHQTIVDLQQRSPMLLPVLAWLPISSTHVLASYHLDTVKFDQELQNLAKHYSQPPTNASITVEQGKAKISPEKPGQTYMADQLQQQILPQLPQLSSHITLHSQSTSPTLYANQLQAALAQVDQQLALPITLTHQDNTYQPNPEERGKWFKINDQKQAVLDQDAIAVYVASIAKELDQSATPTTITLLNGRQIARQVGTSGQSLDQAAAVAAIAQALTNNQPLTYQLVMKKVVPEVQYVQTYSNTSYQYCVAARGVDASLLTEFAATITQTLADPRGWSMGGKLSFRQVQTGCSLTIWLAASSALPQFSSGCSALYSCRVGSNVVINVDPWLHATPAWNSQHGSLADYRSLVINHEVGHWLGFEHWHCSGPGQLAPVMQQQSIDLEGCKINSWPLMGELVQLKTMKGL